mgnify:FL=1
MKCTKCEMINIYDISLYDESIIEFYSQCANCLKITEHDEFKYGPNNPELFINDEYIFSSDGLDYIFYPPIKSKKEQHKLYLKTEKWRQIRIKILNRDDYKCQGCLENKATDVHHITYDNWMNEFMFELISLCRECHTKIHKK